MKLAHAFNQAAKITAKFTGNPLCFGLAAGLVVAWALTGPFFVFQ